MLKPVGAFAERLAIRAVRKAAVFVVCVVVVGTIAGVGIGTAAVGIDNGVVGIGNGVVGVGIVVVIIATSSNPLTPLAAVSVAAANRQETAAVRISELF